MPNAVTGKPGPGPKYAASTRAHSETVLRVFYDFHRDAGTGPMVNPFPLSRERGGGRAHAHHNPMEPFRNERVGLYRPRVAQRIPRCIPDELFNRVFAELGSHRDRALVALWVSTGARAAELLGVRCGDVDPGQQLITVIRKGTPRDAAAAGLAGCVRVAAALPVRTLDPAVPAGRDDPLWWTRRRPFRPLTYHAARAMFTRATAALGANWTLHDLRHTAAYRMARDPQLPLTDVQWVLGHAHLSTTQLYLTPMPGDVIAEVLAHHRRVEQLRRCGRRHARRRRWRRRRRAGIGGSRWTCCSVGGHRERARRAGPGRSQRADRGRAPAVIGPDMQQLWQRFPPRISAPSWPATEQTGEVLAAGCSPPPFTVDRGPGGAARRRLRLIRLLGWLADQPGRHVAAAVAGQRRRRAWATPSGGARCWPGPRPRTALVRGVHVEQPAGHARCCSSAPT